MGLSRRKFFGAAAGGVAAAPAVAKSALSGVECENTGFWRVRSDAAKVEGYDSPFVETESYVRERIKELISDRAGVVEKHQPLLSAARELRIDSLRSVSATNRARMIAEARAAEDLTCELKWIDESIEEMKSKLGVFGQLI